MKADMLFMKLKTHMFMSLLLLPLGVILSCSGGEGGTGAAPDKAMGGITQFGSIFVNGVEYDTATANIQIDGQAATETDLRLGMQVVVSGRINTDGVTGRADTVVVDEVIRGLVVANDSVNRLTVLDQIVEVPATTRFDNVANLSGINAGVLVEVSGFIKSSGVVTATRIEVLSAIVTSKVHGMVNTLTPATERFTFGSLSVDYSLAEFTGLSKSQLSLFSVLEVQGSYDLASHTLSATKVSKETPLAGDSNSLELEGYVTGIGSGGGISFYINNVPVTVDNATVFSGGTTDEIDVGMKLEAEGRMLDGVLIADEVEFEDKVRIEAPLDGVSIDAVSKIGTLSFNGMGTTYTFNTDALTDGDLATLGVGDTVRLRGNLLETANSVVITRVEVRNAGSQVSLQGPVTGFTAETIVEILGLAADVSAVTEFKKQGLVVSKTDFFAELGLGNIVEIRGTLGTNISWTSIEIVD
ncbi:MAG: DUF5666 domain-containing protein [Gammaproteobacteria bacterium]|nr:DUF5666 domain-containing protein [Gammaproteobacteria bacterium]MDH5802906.1 DUF5666 domain-containing protein [Gammaproteobacteria bacterium]